MERASHPRSNDASSSSASLIAIDSYVDDRQSATINTELGEEEEEEEERVASLGAHDAAPGADDSLLFCNAEQDRSS